MNFALDEPMSFDKKTIVWTSCYDAALINRATLWSSVREGRKFLSWGSLNEFAWCLSNDPSDGERFGDAVLWKPYGSRACAHMMKFLPDGQVYSLLYESRRRLSEDQGEVVPSRKDVRDCLLDEDTNDEECDQLVEQIFSYSDEHPELWIASNQPGGPGNAEPETETTTEEDDVDSVETDETNGDASGSSLRRLLYKLN